MSACATQSHTPQPIDPDVTAAAFESRSLDAPGLQAYMATHSERAWPLDQWGLTELTLLALYDHPRVNAARARASAARADMAVAVQRAPLGLTPIAEHHSEDADASNSPWSVGLSLEIPLGGRAQSEAVREQYGYLAQAAALDIGSTAWDIRSQLRARLLEYYSARAQSELLQTEVDERRRLLQLLEKRLSAGALSALDVSHARLGYIEAEARLRTSQSTIEQARTSLAETLAWPMQVVAGMDFDLSLFDRMEPVPTDADTRKRALLNRTDLRAKLLAYAAADAEVKLEVARQYPSIKLSPGYLWDQGDNVWSLAASLLLPATAGNRASIRAAQARREVAAAEFVEMQSGVIVQAQAASELYTRRMAAVSSAQELVDAQESLARQAQKRFDAGYIDRVDLTEARIEAIAARVVTLAARLDLLKAQGSLEDALQIPLGDPRLPTLPDPPAAAASPSTGIARQ